MLEVREEGELLKRPQEIIRMLRKAAEGAAENRRAAEYGPGGGNPAARADQHLEWHAAEALVVALDRVKFYRDELGAMTEGVNFLAKECGHILNAAPDVDDEERAAADERKSADYWKRRAETAEIQCNRYTRGMEALLP